MDALPERYMPGMVGRGGQLHRVGPDPAAAQPKGQARSCFVLHTCACAHVLFAACCCRLHVPSARQPARPSCPPVLACTHFWVTASFLDGAAVCLKRFGVMPPSPVPLQAPLL